MDTLLEMDLALQDDLSVGDESSFFSPERRKRALNRAYVKIGGIYRWPDLSDSLITSSEPNTEYYKTPDNWRPNSAWKLSIRGVDQKDPLSFKDFQYEVENGLPSGLDSIWSTYGKKFFINPVMTSAGEDDIIIWGQENVETLSEDDDTTIFSYSQPEVNEAIVLEAEMILKNKSGEVKEGQLLSAEAKTIVALAWDEIKRQTAKYEKTIPFLDVPDFFKSGSGVNKIGNF